LPLAKIRASLEKPPDPLSTLSETRQTTLPNASEQNSITANPAAQAQAGVVIHRFPSFLNRRGDRRGVQSQTGA
jgi:hypothetical protein